MKLQSANKKIGIVAVCFVVVLCLSIALASNFTANGTSLSQLTEKVVAFKDVTNQVDLSNVKLENLSEFVMANVDMNQYEQRSVIVSLKEKNLVQSAGGGDVVSYISSVAGKKQKRLIDIEQEKFLNDLNKLGIEYELITNYDTVLNGVAISVNTAYVSIIKLMDNVQSVVLSETYAAPQTTSESGSATSDITNQTSVYATGIYNSSKYADEYGGKGMVVAVLDTGLDYTHEAFQTEPDASYIKYTKADIEALMETENFVANGDVYVSDKVPFAYDYADHDADVYPSYSNHGTHVAGIIAGSASSYSDKDGNVPKDENENPIPFKSVAPNAQLVICKVFTDNLDSINVGGATTEDIVDALDDCVKLGVDVINMSLGTTCGFSSTNDGDDEGELLHRTYTSIQEAGISLICAASNDYSSAYGGAFGTNLTSNPDSGTVGSPSTFEAALSVASISGKKSPFILANAKTAVFYSESSDENNVDYDFAELMLNGAESASFQYVVVKGTYYGSSADYNTSYIKKAISGAHAEGKKIIALVKRGGNLTFQEKVENAMAAGADAIIVYNNVAGEIKMTIGDVDDPIPAISISYEAGENMVKGATNNVGVITINPAEYEAGPFMSGFSSWGTTPDLKLKPEITAHGGEITSSVPGGWDEQSGTSMATPNVAGLVANIRSFIAQEWEQRGFFDQEPTSNQITALTNQLMMSTATIVVDQEALPYSPRKQGAGLASLENIIDKTSAYLFTKTTDEIASEHGTYYGAEDNRPKIELGEDQNKVGKYTLKFYINNLKNENMSFVLNSLFMTESVSLDGLAVGEQAYMLGGNAVWSVNGTEYADGDTVSVGEGVTEITVKLSLSNQERAYLEKNFENGMFIEGFLQLKSATDGQCDLSLPFLGFYGDWEAAPMLDYDAFEIAEIEQDTSIPDEEKPKASVWATQAYAIYWNNQFVLPMGSFVYKQNEDDDEVRKIYTTEEYSSISCYNEYTGVDSNNYMTSTGIKGIYAGLLRNAKQVDCRMYNVATGELIYNKEIYRVNKAYSNGGSTTPGFVKLELTPAELGLIENGQYRMEFDFHYKTPDENTVVDPENTFTFSFYVDYTAPVLEEARVRYFDYKSGNKDKQKIYLDLDVYDNHYSMAVLLCYMDSTDPENPTLQLCTEYVTPIYDAKKNGTTTVSIEITDIVEKYGDNLYVEIDDYALNHSVYQINVNDAQKEPLPDSFELAEGEENITIGKYSTHKVSLAWDKKLYPTANISNFTWTVSGKSSSIVAVKNGEIVGLSAGTGTVTVSNGKTTKEIKVTVTDNDKKLNMPSISFDVILNDVKAPVKAQGMVSVNIAQDIKLDVVTDPWYYTLVNDLDLEWVSRDTSVATVDDDGNVTLLKKGRVSIVATIKGTAYSATVMFSVQEPFKVSSYALTGYEGAGGVVYIPTDMNIMTIGENAFKDKKDITAVVIPKTVTTIDERAFYGCTNLKYVFFVDVVTQEIAESDLTLINREAFVGCTSLEYIDFSNCKTFTVARNAFYGCSSLKLIKGMEHVGTAYSYAFANCSSLVGSVSSRSGVMLVNPEATEWDTVNNRITDVEVIPFENLKDKENNVLVVNALDIQGLHVAGDYVFQGCSALESIKTGQFTAIGTGMFADCRGLKNLVLEDVANVGRNAFEKCFGLKTVTFKTESVNIGEGAFNNCGNLTSVSYATTSAGQETSVVSIGASAFKNTALKSFTIPNGLEKLGDQILYGSVVTEVEFTVEQLASVKFEGNPFKGMTILVKDQAESEIVYSADFKKLVYVNPSVDFATLAIDSRVEEIGDYAFADTAIKSIVIPASVKVIGKGTFKNSALETVTFESGSALEKIDAEAFYGTKIKNITVPNGVVTVGDYAFAYSSIATFNYASTAESSFGDGVFAGCQSLVEIDLSGANITSMGSFTFMNAVSLANVKLSSLSELGRFTFMGATGVQTVVFGENSTTLGNSTFMTYANNGEVAAYDSLTSVIVGAGVTAIPENAFVYCTTLQEIDIRNATKIGDLAFYGCTALSEVTGLENVTDIGMYAFWNCKALRELDLQEVENIGVAAFRVERQAEEKALSVIINMPKVQTIGAYAFFGTGAQTINLPATIWESQSNDALSIEGKVSGSNLKQPIGIGAFSNAPNLIEIKVAKENPTYFDENGVLYRNVTDKTYELVNYPSSGKAVEYVVKAGTVRVEAYAFAGAKLLQKVTLPYSVVTLGNGAFYDSTVQTYVFESHVAPTLESEFDETLKQYLRVDISFRGMFYSNFVDYVLEYTEEVSSIATGNVSTLTMTYPKNGNGYDNYLYNKYFTSRKQGDYVLTNDARTVKNNLEKMDATTVSAWLESSFAVNEANRATVTAFAELLKETHRLYNNVSSDKNQVALINQTNIDKMTEIETVLRQVKSKFGIASKIAGYSFSGNYKKNYAVGETFDISGLVVTLIYDDYSTSDFTGADLQLASSSNRPLTTLDRLVQIELGGRSYAVDINVTEAVGGGEEETVQPEPEKNDNLVVIVVCSVLGGIIVLLGIAIGVLILLNKKGVIAFDLIKTLKNVFKKKEKSNNEKKALEDAPQQSTEIEATTATEETVAEAETTVADQTDADQENK